MCFGRPSPPPAPAPEPVDSPIEDTADAVVVGKQKKKQAADTKVAMGENWEPNHCRYHCLITKKVEI